MVDLLTAAEKKYAPFPRAGWIRIPPDCSLTNDGELNHRLISPKWEIDKVYQAVVEQPISDGDVLRFAGGIVISEGYQCKAAGLRALDETGTLVEVIIHEGKFHQVKRMFEALGNRVLQLKRVKFGPLQLPVDLPEGSYRELRKDELEALLHATELAR